MTICSVSSKFDQASWDAYVDGFSGATAYHQYAWKGVIERSFGHSVHYLGAVDSRGALQGILPLVHMKSLLFGNFLVSVPFVNYGGLLCNSEAAQTALLDEAEKIRASLAAGHVELRHLGHGLEGLPTSEHKVTMVLPLKSNVAGQWAGFNPKLRNQIRKADKSRLKCVEGHLDLLDDFYGVFAQNMRDLGTPVYAKAFFAEVLSSFPDTTRIFAVSYEGKTIAAGIGAWFRQTIEMPWASSIGEYKSLCPNNMLYWEAIKFGIHHGFSSFDFGRSTPNEGTYNFKKHWGAEPVQLYWQYLMADGCGVPELNPKNPKYQLAIRVWKKLPVVLTRIIGPKIVRGIP